MFSSNQIFNITGDKESQLKVAIHCAMQFLDAKEMRYYKVQNGYIMFTEYGTEEKNGLQRIPISGDTDMVAMMAQKFLKTPDAKESLNAYDFGDGSTYKGWELFIPEDYYGIGDAFAIRPYTTFYHK